MAAVREAGTELLPVDSRALGRLPGDRRRRLRRASSASCSRLRAARSAPGASSSWRTPRPQQALRHPNWSMGRKITIDSATLMNKGLELIEAYHLFPVDRRPARASSCIRSRSCTASSAITDGSVLAQLATPDMRTPIALALSWPQRMAAPTKRLDLVDARHPELRAPDEARFPALASRARRCSRAAWPRPCSTPPTRSRSRPFWRDDWGSFKSPNLWLRRWIWRTAGACWARRRPGRRAGDGRGGAAVGAELAGDRWGRRECSARRFGAQAVVV